MENKNVRYAANATDKLSDTVNQAADTGSDAIEAARDYADKSLGYAGDLGDRLSDFARRDPWLTVFGAFAIGYVAAHFFRRSR
jgi:hypothetical protein